MLKKLLPFALVFIAVGCSGGGDDGLPSPFEGAFIGTVDVIGDDTGPADIEIVIDDDGSIFGTVSGDDGEGTVRGDVDDDGQFTMIFRQGGSESLEDNGVFVFDGFNRLLGSGRINFGGGITFETRYDMDRD